MKFDTRPRGALRLTPCTYGLSKVPFRGPRRRMNGRYVAFIGGSETFAKYIAQPFPDLIEQVIGEVCVNLGCQSAGPDVFLQDTAVQSMCHDATVTVIQIMGAVNLCNPFYKVHPRRNDRFIRPTEKLVTLFPEIDFAEISFTGHLIAKLRDVDEDRFAVVRAQLEVKWVRRMKALIGKASGPVFLLWLASQTSDNANIGAGVVNVPAFVTPAMIEQLRPYVADIIGVTVEHGDTAGMCFAPLDELSARHALSIAAHVTVAKVLREPLLRYLG